MTLLTVMAIICGILAILITSAIIYVCVGAIAMFGDLIVFTLIAYVGLRFLKFLKKVWRGL